MRMRVRIKALIWNEFQPNELLSDTMNLERMEGFNAGHDNLTNKNELLAFSKFFIS
jgi:hypothetical protein